MKMEELWARYNSEVDQIEDDMNGYDPDSDWAETEYRNRELEIRKRYPFEEMVAWLEKDLAEKKANWEARQE